MSKRACTIYFVALLTVVAACGDGGTNTAADLGTTSAALKGIDAYAVLKGSAAVEITTSGTPAKVELLADGKVVATATTAPFALTFDTAALKDGVVELSLRCDDLPMDGKVKVIVLNKGQEAAFTDGSGGTITVPADGNYLDPHLKYHWQMAKGVKRVIAMLTWREPTFDLELAIGMGECPDHGTLAAKGQSKDAPLVVTFGQGGPDLGTGTWFAHVAFMNVSDKATHGKSGTFSIKTYLLVD